MGPTPAVGKTLARETTLATNVCGPHSEFFLVVVVRALIVTVVLATIRALTATTKRALTATTKRALCQRGPAVVSLARIFSTAGTCLGLWAQLASTTTRHKTLGSTKQHG